MAFGNMLIQIIPILLLCSGAESYCKQGLSITTPTPMDALSGSCLLIPCTFSTYQHTFYPKKSVIGFWSKTDTNHVIYKSDGSVNTYPMSITGNLKNKDCTTLFNNLITAYTDKYYFRIENDPYKAWAQCEPLLITVRDSPWSPSIEISGKQTETELVTITCSAVTPCPHSPPQLTWDLQQGTPNITETNSDGTFTTKTKLNITLTDSHDGLLIKCSAVYPVTGGNKTTENNITFNVTYAPKNTSVWVSPSGSLSAGQLVKLSCSSRAKPPVDHFTWFRHNSQGPVSVYEDNIYNFSICEDGDYYCVASNKLGNESSSVIQLGINDVPWKPSIEISGKQTETELVTITCSAVTPCPHSPPQLTWDLQQGTPNITETNSDGTFTTKTKLNITLTDSHDGLLIKCSAAYPVTGGHKTTENNITLNVTYAPKNTSVWVSPSGSLSAGQLVKLSCSSRAKPPVDHFTWFRHSSQGPVSVYEGDTYSFNLTEDGDYYCVASNKLGNHSSTVFQLRITKETNPSDGGGLPAGLPWEAILGAGIALLIIICLAVLTWRFKRKCRPPKDTQRQTFVKGAEETIHYGEIDISKLRPKEAPNMNLDNETKEETVYSQVQVSKAKAAEEETVHYGEIDLSKLRPKEASNMNLDKELKEETVYSQVQVSKAKAAKEETVHYGEIDFSKLSPKVVPDTEQEETVYSQVQGSKEADGDGLESLYVNVKK